MRVAALASIYPQFCRSKTNFDTALTPSEFHFWAANSSGAPNVKDALTQTLLTPLHTGRMIKVKVRPMKRLAMMPTKSFD